MLSHKWLATLGFFGPLRTWPAAAVLRLPYKKGQPHLLELKTRFVRTNLPDSEVCQVSARRNKEGPWEWTRIRKRQRNLEIRIHRVLCFRPQ
jgi:hypothetical protein